MLSAVTKDFSECELSVSGSKNTDTWLSFLYESNQLNHPACNQICVGCTSSTSAEADTRSVGPICKPEPPEKPVLPYMKYSKKIWDDIKIKKPDLKLWQIGKVIGRMWKDLPVVDKQPYIEEYNKEKADYLIRLRSYHNSSAYQHYLQTKHILKDTEVDSDHSSFRQTHSDEFIQDTDDSLAGSCSNNVVKFAAARFQRNHCLMHTILLDPFVVPEENDVITNKELFMLRSKVQLLNDRCTELQVESCEIEVQQCLAKRNWLENHHSFSVEFEKACYESMQFDRYAY